MPRLRVSDVVRPIIRLDVRLKSCAVFIEGHEAIYLTVKGLVALLKSRLTEKEVYTAYNKALQAADLFFETPSGPKPGGEAVSPPFTMLMVQDLAAIGMSQSAIAAVLGVSQPYVSKLVDISKLPLEIVQHWTKGAVTESFRPAKAVIPYQNMYALAQLSTSKSRKLELYTDLTRKFAVIRPNLPQEAESDEPDWSEEIARDERIRHFKKP